MAAIRFEQVQRFILVKKIFRGWRHFKASQKHLKKLVIIRSMKEPFV